MVRRRAGRLWFLLMLCAACACSEDGKPKPWDFDFADITGEPAGDNRTLGVDLYLDSTVSMSGFVGSQTSSLNDLVRDLEGAAQTGWKSVSVRYFKFGTTVVESKREPFLLGMRDARFFKQKGMSETTNIDAVLAQSDASRLTLVITDLFQDAGDVNAVVGALKDNLIAKSVAVGILPVLSEFGGTVYDAKVPPYQYRSTVGDAATYRAFYLLMFGGRHDMQRLVAVMGAKPYIDRARFLLLTPHVTKSQAAELSREDLSRNLVLTSEKGGPNEFFVDLREGSEASLAVRVRVDQTEATPPLRSDRLEMTAVKRTATEEGATGDVTLAGPIVSAGHGELRLPLRISLTDRKGYYAYRIDLTTPTLNAFDTPGWVAALHSSNPTSSLDPNKTLNLEPFVRGLIQAGTSVRQSSVARVFLRIRKR